jgi:lipopolysaccharide export system protein LptA
VKKTILLCTLSLALALPAAFSQRPEAPRSESELLRQIESLNGSSGGSTPVLRPSVSAVTAGTEDAKPAETKPPLKKDKGPTEITADEATFDQKTNEAVFIGDVVVKDPEFNVTCDKLIATMKNKTPGGEAGKVPKPPATPGAEGSKKKGGGGLQKATAEATSGHRVVITQDKLEADGTTSRSTGYGARATYDAVTGDIVLTGSPEVIQGYNHIIAIDPDTKMRFNRDGHMSADRRTKTTIVDKAGAGL